MGYRRLNSTELVTLIRELSLFQIWREYTAFARDVYGRSAERIEIAVGAEYNDRSFHAVIDAVEVYDSTGMRLEPDLATDWWQRVLNARDPDDYTEDWISVALTERQTALPLLARSATFFVSQPPRRTHPTVYVTD